MRKLVTRLWQNWSRLTLDQRREGLNGTNNASERVIGWWLKERYQTMRGYKRTESIRNVVTLTARIRTLRHVRTLPVALWWGKGPLCLLKFFPILETVTSNFAA